MIREFLEYASEALAIISLVIYVSTRYFVHLEFCALDIAYIIALCAFLWSRGYAEYLERKIDQLQREAYKKNYKLIEYQS